jgi:WD40 repeat protein
MKISNDKQHLACATSAGVKLYDLSHDADMANKSNFAYPANVTSIGFKKSCSWLYAGSEDGTIRVHDLRLSGSQMVYKNDSEINSVALSPTEGELIAGD